MNKCGEMNIGEALDFYIFIFFFSTNFWKRGIIESFEFQLCQRRDTGIESEGMWGTLPSLLVEIRIRNYHISLNHGNSNATAGPDE